MGSGPKLITADYHVLPGDPSAKQEFKFPPYDVVLVAALELSVRDSSGSHVLVTNPRYDVVNGGDDGEPPESAQWAVPYVTRRVDKKNRKAWKTVGGILKAIEQAKEEWDPTEALGGLMATWAVGLTDLELLGEFTEYKRSWSNPQVPKIYHVMRYAASSDECEPRALADPESRQGFSYLPIDDDRYSRVITDRECARHKRIESVFLARPLASNLRHVLSEAHERDRLREKAVPLEESDFFYDVSGYVVAGDIAGYGAACEYAHKMGTIDFGGDEAAARLRTSATGAFTQMFHEAGIWQVHTAGDGFIAGVPVDADEDGASALARFLQSYLGLLRLLDRTRGLIDDHRTKNKSRAKPGDAGMLGSRLAIHFGEYRYGKMAQAASLASAFDGQAITFVSRLEQGLRTIVKDPTSDGGSKLEGVLHSAIASDEAVKEWGGLAKTPPMLDKLGKAAALSKEFKRKASIFAVQDPG